MVSRLVNDDNTERHGQTKIETKNLGVKLRPTVTNKRLQQSFINRKKDKIIAKRFKLAKCPLIVCKDQRYKRLNQSVMQKT